jgi:hypothetical protein
VSGIASIAEPLKSMEIGVLPPVLTKGILSGERPSL